MKQPLKELHLTCRQHGEKAIRFTPTDVPGEFESGYWVASQATRRDAIGAEIHLHENHKMDSWACGHIIAWRDAPEKGKVIYRFRANDTLSRNPPPVWPGQGLHYIPRRT